ncbi:MAG: type II CAAX endopeptidase family protein [Cytophagales bacterium]|nr:type II CAAX endopeptidase family protein [Cytophagales bacterium]
MHATQQLTLPRLVFEHFYVGCFITIFYVLCAPLIIEEGLPSHIVLLSAELLILLPLVGGHMLWLGRKFGGFKQLIPFTQSLSVKQLLIWTLGGMLISLLIYIPLYPVGIFLRESIFSWLPEWYFNPGFGTEDMELIARVFLVGIFIDGFVGPIVEEFFFRGYLLPRMAFLKKWAPVLNGMMFGLYHFWQPHNLIAICAMGIILSTIVWKTKNVYLGIAIHCTLNVIGAIGGYYAAANGLLIDR